MIVSFAVKKGPTPEEMVAHIYSEPGDGYIYQYDAVWATARDSALGYLASDGDSNEEVASARDAGSFYIVLRSFFEFDLSSFAAEGRTIESISFDITGWSFNDSTVQIQEATFSGALTTADFQEFTGGMFLDTPFTWEIWDGGDPAHNVMTLNASGQSYIESNFEGTVKLCVRDSEFDVADSIPVTGNRMGGYYADDSVTQIPDVRTPKLIINYLKIPVWTSHFNNTDWSAYDGGTWDGVKWSSVGNQIGIQANAFATDYVPYKIRLTFDGVADVYVELTNDHAFVTPKNLFDGRETFVSGEEKVINSYNNYNLDILYVYGTGPFNITNIEFLEA